ncbi:protein FAR1-RELATED SEQUENCE 5-like [Silene latifolia]|uniref:protein FAR1-RELATED SEQUENCE 5-like n=1 Tax=Silene latifolia TaxID=37657 RepID=UPI003D78B2CF
MTPLNSSNNDKDNSSILSQTSSNVITNEGANVEANACQPILEISAIAVENDVPEVVTFEFVEDIIVEEAEDEEAAEGSSSNTNRVFECLNHLKPVIGMLFDKLELGVEFYEAYAKESGFVTRLSSQKSKNGVVTHKKVVCNKAGVCEAKGKNHRRQRTRIECPSCIKFKRILEEGPDMGKYQIYDFHEGHNHMPQTPSTMVHLTQTRELNVVHKKMIIDNSKNNIGPVKSYRLFKEYVRGYRNVGASLEDFKNFSRDIKNYLS